MKALAKAAVEPLGPDEVKDVETSLAGIRSDKTKVGAGDLLVEGPEWGGVCCVTFGTQSNHAKVGQAAYAPRTY